MKQNTDSDSENDIDSDILVDAIKSPSILKDSLDRIKNSRKPKQNFSVNEGSSSSIKTLLKRRKKSPSKQLKREYNVEVESAVEMMEDMILLNEQTDGFEDAVENLTPENCPGLKDSISGNNYKTDSKNNNFMSTKTKNALKNNEDLENKINNLKFHQVQQKSFHDYILLFYENRALIFGLISILIVYFLQIPQFLQGVLACLFCFLLFSNLYDLSIKFVNKNIINSRNTDNDKFEMPDYSKLPICEIPAVEEHQVLKSYTVSNLSSFFIITLVYKKIV